MLFRIGINVGDVIVEADRIYGDGVNIAARIEGLATGGGVCISGTVYDQVEGKLDFIYEDLGAQSVKNIAKPVRVYRVLGAPAETAAPKSIETKPTTRETPPALDEKPSLAVMPFVNLSGDPEQEYFSDGLTEDLITDLSKVSGLLVISRTSVMSYKGQTLKSEQIGRELGARYVVEGSVRKAGNRVRITAQLADASSDYHLWAERYDGLLDDIFALQDQVIQQIVAALAVKLTVAEKARVSAAPTHNLEAHDAFVRGREQHARRDRVANIEARKLFEQAIALDANYAEAHAYLGRTYSLEIINQWSDATNLVEQVFRYGERAVELDESQPTAHETLAHAWLAQRRHSEAIAEARMAIAYDPNSADAYVNLAEILSFDGQPAEAIPLVAHAMRLNPLYTPNYLWTLGHAHWLMEEQTQAIGLMQRVLTRNPDHLVAHMVLTGAYVEIGQTDAARRQAQEIIRISPSYSVELFSQRVPYRDSSIIARQVANMHKAGLN
jgi:adenylate cyclase